MSLFFVADRKVLDDDKLSSNDKVIYKVTYNGTPNKFLKDLINNNFVVDKTGEIWKLNRN